MGNDSGGGTTGIGSAWSTPGSSIWNEADIVKIGLPFWMATTRRVVNDTPSRVRSTWYTIGCRGLPGRRKYECSECTRRSLGTVRPAAISACAATCPPNTRTGDIAGDTPR